MFDLDEEIKSWRSKLAGQEAFQPAHLDELEDHLRSNVTKLSSGEITTEEAFLLSSRRLGTHDELNREFSKNDGANIWVSRVMWMLVGVIVLRVIGSLSSVVAAFAHIGNLYLFGSGTVAGISYWVGYLLVWGILFFAICRQATSGDTLWIDRFAQLGIWSTKRPVATIAILVSATIGISVLCQALYLSTFRMITPELVGYWRAIGSFVFSFLQLLLIAGTAIWLYRRQHQPTQTAD